MTITTITDYATLFTNILEINFLGKNGKKIPDTIIKNQILKEIYSDNLIVGFMMSNFSINANTEYPNFSIKKTSFNGVQSTNKFLYSIHSNKPYTHFVTNIESIITTIYHSLEGDSITNLAASKVYILNIA